MAIISSTLKYSDRRGERSDSGLVFTDVYQQLTDTSMSTAQMYADASQIVYGQQHSEVPQAVARSVTPVQSGPFYWLTTVVWRTPDGADPGGGIFHPLDMPAKFREFARQIEEPIDVDAEGKPYVNSALEPYAGITRPFADRIVVIEKNLPYNPGPQVWPRLNTVNTMPIYDNAPERALLANYAIEAHTDLSIGIMPYWSLMVEWHCRLDGWNRLLRDEGFREWVQCSEDGFPIWRVIRDEEGNPMNVPVPLDGEGNRLANTGIPCHPSFHAEKIVINEFVDFLPADHSVFDFSNELVLSPPLPGGSS